MSVGECLSLMKLLISLPLVNVQFPLVVCVLLCLGGRCHSWASREVTGSCPGQRTFVENNGADVGFLFFGLVGGGGAVLDITRFGLVPGRVASQVVIRPTAFLNLVHDQLLSHVFCTLAKIEYVMLSHSLLHIRLVDSSPRLGHSTKVGAVVLHQDKLWALALLVASNHPQECPCAGIFCKLRLKLREPAIACCQLIRLLDGASAYSSVRTRVRKALPGSASGVLW
mmetsp:Transcript_6648/g.10515  ORF Transcript_6648/g.10515 Transcript_6648/m.10515 type:complete len:226 (+) Transcript_6648:954-1631(+)